MKKEDLMEAMNGIDAKDIEESELKGYHRNHFASLKILAACACAVIIIGAVYGTSLLRTDQKAVVENNEADQIIDEESGAQPVNPMEEASIDGMLHKWGATLKTPEGASDVAEYIIHLGGNADILERQFIYEKIHYSARVQRSEEFLDISGMYYSWDIEENVKIAGMDGKVMKYVSKETSEEAAVCLCYDAKNKLMYALIADGEGAGEVDIAGVASLMQ